MAAFDSAVFLVLDVSFDRNEAVRASGSGLIESRVIRQSLTHHGCVLMLPQQILQLA